MSKYEERMDRPFDAQKISFFCEGCGSLLNPEVEQKQIICPYCGTEYLLNWETDEDETEQKEEPKNEYYFVNETRPATREISWEELLAKGQQYEQNGDISGAYACYKKVLKLNPGNKEAWHGIERIRVPGNKTSKMPIGKEITSENTKSKSGIGCFSIVSLVILFFAFRHLFYLIITVSAMTYAFIGMHKIIFPNDFIDGKVPLLGEKYGFICHKSRPVYMLGAVAVFLLSMAGAWYLYGSYQAIYFYKIVGIGVGGTNLLFSLACLVTKKKWHYLPGIVFSIFILLAAFEGK